MQEAVVREGRWADRASRSSWVGPWCETSGMDMGRESR
ncbi:hypothetical protein [Streptomyces rubiginosohelvolus]